MFRGGIRQFRYTCVCAIILLLPFMSYVRIGGKTLNISYADIVLPPALLLTFTKTFHVDDSRLKKYIKHMGFLLAITVCSVFNAVKWENVGASLRGFAISMLKLLVCLGYIHVFSHFLSENKQKVRQIIDLFVFSSVADAALAYVGVALRAAGIRNAFVYQNSFRACGSFSDPNLFACFLFIGLYLTIYNLQRLKKNKYLFAAFFQIGAILLTASKAAILALIAFSGFLLIGILVKPRKRYRISSLLAIMAILSLFLALAFGTDVFKNSFNRFNTLLNSDNDDISTGRFTIWARSLKLIADSPILGVGLGMHNVAAQQLLYTSSDFVFHNTYLNYIVELGVFGLFWTITAVRYVLKCQIIMLKAEKNYQLLGLLIAILLMVFTLDLENFRNLWVFFCLLMQLTTKTTTENGNE